MNTFLFAKTAISTQKGNLLDWFFHSLFTFAFSRGFQFVEAPDIDNTSFVFDKLGIPDEHVCRSKKDTFYILDNVVLRPHTTSINTHFLSDHTRKLFTIGNVYRRDDDSTHLPSFHQMEFVHTHKNANILECFELCKDIVSFAITRLGYIFNCNIEKVSMRFRPHFFPYTSPSFEMDISCNCKHNCKACKLSWTEVLGCGILRKEILSANGVSFNAIAAGIGVERLILFCMQMSGISCRISDLYK